MPLDTLEAYALHDAAADLVTSLKSLREDVRSAIGSSPADKHLAAALVGIRAALDALDPAVDELYQAGLTLYIKGNSSEA